MLSFLISTSEMNLKGGLTFEFILEVPQFLSELIIFFNFSLV
jgi:hypothetical protein